MEKLLIFLRRLYWLILAIIALVYSLTNLDLLRERIKADLLFGKLSFQGFWLLLAVVLAFLIEALISGALIVAARRRAARSAQELAQLKAKAAAGGSSTEAEK